MLIVSKELLNNIEGALTKVHGVALSADFYEHLDVKIHVQVFIKISCPVPHHAP